MYICTYVCGKSIVSAYKVITNKAIQANTITLSKHYIVLRMVRTRAIGIAQSAGWQAGIGRHNTGGLPALFNKGTSLLQPN